MRADFALDSDGNAALCPLCATRGFAGLFAASHDSGALLAVAL